jgi:hypothetical protein
LILTSLFDDPGAEWIQAYPKLDTWLTTALQDPDVIFIRNTLKEKIAEHQPKLDIEKIVA